MEGLAGHGDTSHSRTLSILSVLFLVASFGLCLLVSRIRRGRQRYPDLPLPPGPPRLPIIGNLFNSPTHYSWLTHLQWKHVYGPVAYYEVGGQPTVVLTTVEAAHELLNKRASNYSNRSFGYTVSELVCKGYNMLFRQYDARLRLHQRLHVHGLNPQSSVLYHAIEEMESLQLLNDMLAEGKPKPGQGTGEKQTADVVPQNPHWDFRRASASAMSLIVWGYRLRKGQPGTEYEMDFFNNTSTLEVLTAPPWWIDAFTWLRHVPRCVSPWKRAGEKLHEREVSHHLANFRRALKLPGYNISKQVARGADRLGADGLCEAELAFVAAALTLANGETTVTILCWLVVAMVTYPRVMREAQAELDDVVGRARMPTYADRAALPYVNAVIDEVMRWRPLIPDGMVHAAAEEDEFMGYRIPRGAAVVASQWAITRDRDAFGADADDFRPERWLERDDLPRTSFGYGRRLCPGRHVGRDGLWIMAARLLWAFDMESPPADDPAASKKKKKRVIDPMAMPPFGIVIAPQPFEALFRPRGEWVEALVSKGMEDVESDAGNLMEQIGIAKGFH
ncbi:cytochrome P450 [Colletotrichum graminicola]|uniref:Cytochrome P450 n=1 Tax=Colletotrichum graminicola (strain M1.001 / M2 / FGSC 10212) TaxID=645133 RepID=E3QL55_COLGM|nr:cytochrome P450 [Colletotrichum graminicola M1.001]EFQ31593.1 cytochrome P450 [Colletotrichum graminicola M1.001]WDK10169.1 cytochrome P450 [Colletotrichum graminicola]